MAPQNLSCFVLSEMTSTGLIEVTEKRLSMVSEDEEDKRKSTHLAESNSQDTSTIGLEHSSRSYRLGFLCIISEVMIYLQEMTSIQKKIFQMESRNLSKGQFKRRKEN